MIRGIDKGTTYTKDDLGNIIKSTIIEGDDILLDNKLNVEMFNKKFIVGEKGRYGTDLMKSQHENTKILVYTVLALGNASNMVSESIVLGLPIGLYTRQKEDMKNLFTDEAQSIIINGQKKVVQIKSCEVFPESAGAFYTQTEKSGLVVDIGGLSIDNALFENSKLQKYSTYSMGTMKLYNKIANSINSSYDLSLTEWDIPNIFKNGLKIDGKDVELKVESIIKNHTIDIIERLKLDYDIRKENIMLTGGGSLLLHSYLKEKIPQVKLLDPRFANAKGFKQIGEVIFR